METNQCSKHPEVTIAKGESCPKCLEQKNN